MATQLAIRINGLTATEMGFREEILVGWADGQDSSRSVATRPGPFGGLSSALESVAPRIIRFVGLIDGTTLETRDAALDQVIQNLEGLLEVSFEDSLGKVVFAELSRPVVAGEFQRQSFVIPDLRVTVELRAVQSPKIDVFSSIVRLGSALTNGGILVGTAPTLGRIWLHDATNPVFTLLDWRGNEVESLELTVSLSGSETVLVDLYQQEIYDVDDEVTLTRQDGYLTGGDFFEVLPKYADRTNELWPKLTVDDGEGWFEFKRFWRS